MEVKKDKAAGKRWRWKLAGVLLFFLVAGAAAWHYVGSTWYTDGSGLRARASDANLREVLWTPPQPLAADAAAPQQEYEPCLSADGRELFFVRGKAGHGTGADLYVSERRGMGWSEPAALAAVNGPSDELGPSLSADGRILFFYSDRAGGLGQYDLWAAPRLPDGGFGAPFNLGSNVNSPFNEYSPAPSPDGRRLFFASNRKAAAKSGAGAWRATIRQGDLGDYDLFSAELSSVSRPATRPATGPATLPAAPAALVFQPAAEVPNVNTTSHEGACAVSPHGDFLYFTSNRPGGHGGFDIYRVRLSASAVGAAPENLGPQVNTADNEADPHAADGGFRLYFSSDRLDHQTYRLYTTDSREVFAVRVTPPLPRVSRSWLAFILAVAALLPLLLYLQGAERGRFSLLQKCLVASLLLHLALTMMISGVHVSNEIIAYVRDRAGDGDGIGAGFGSNTEAEVMLQVRGQMTDLSAPAAGPSALARAEVASSAVAAAAAPAPVSIELPKGQPLPAALALEAVAPQPFDVVTPVLAPNLPAVSAHGPDAAVRAPAAPALQADPALQVSAPQVGGIARQDARGDAVIPGPTLGSRQAPAAQVGSGTSLVQAPVPTANAGSGGGVGAIGAPAAKAEAPAPGSGTTLAAAPRAAGPIGASGPDAAVAPGAAVGSPALGPSQSGASGAGQLPQMRGVAGPAVAGTGSIAQGPGIEAGVVRTAPDAAVTPSVPIGGASGAGPVIEAAPAKPAGPLAGGSGEAGADAPRVAIGNVKSEPQSTGVPGGGSGQPSVNVAVPGASAATGSIASAAPLGAAGASVEMGGGASTRPAAVPDAALVQSSPAPVDVAGPKAAAPRPGAGDGGPSAPSVTAAAPLPVEAAQVSSPGVGAGPASFEPRPLAPTASVGGTGPLAVAPVAPQLPAGAPQSITVIPRTGVGPGGGRPDGDLPEGLSQRSMEQRQPLLEKMGGSPESEAAVARALAYLARNQEPDGRWTMVVDERPPGRRGEDRHDPGLTALAALAFLASDHTPSRRGPYQQVTHKAFEHLLSVQQRNGDCRGAGDMYDHALVTIAFAEAAIMTGDKRYKEAATAGAEFIVATIDRNTGGWRYKPFQAGDTSVVGWQVMALKSVQTLDPEGSAISPSVRQHALRFLSSVSSGRSRVLAGYQPGREPTPPMTAEATFARILLGQQLRDAQVSEFTHYVFDNAPGKYEDNFYYWYYTSLTLLQLGGQSWKEWNPLVRDRLVELQHKEGREAGSWDYDQSRHGIRNGRIYSTVMATLTLEVYYRYLPMYGKAEKAGEAANGR